MVSYNSLQSPRIAFHVHHALDGYGQNGVNESRHHVFDVFIRKDGFAIRPGGSVVKYLLANAGDMGSVCGPGRSPGEGNGT